MLSKAEAGIVQRDPAVPGLSTVLDADAFADALRRRLPAADLREARITYIRYKPRTNCLVGYRLEFADWTVAATAKAYQRNASPGNSGRLVFDDCDVLVSVFPDDRKITSLPRLAKPDARARMIRRVVGRHRSSFQEGTIEELAYKPERRYVAKLSVSEGPRLVLKFYTERNYLTAWHSSRAFDSRPAVRLAPRIGDSDRYRVLAFGWLPGRRLSDAIGDPNFNIDSLRTVGAAIAELHAQNPSGLEYRGGEIEASSLVCDAERLALLCPHLSKRARRLARTLAAQLVDQAAISRPIHGDLHAGQILIENGTVGLLDLDRAVRANPMADIGLFIAHLDREHLRGNLESPRVDELAASFLEGYFDPRAPELGTVRVYRAAALLRLAPECFRRSEPEWPDRTEAMLQRSEDIVNREFADS